MTTPPTYTPAAMSRLLNAVKSIPADYPPELLAARRKAFKRQIHEAQTVAEIPNTEFGSRAWFAGVEEETI